jgi:hypothetical protein
LVPRGANYIFGKTVRSCGRPVAGLMPTEASVATVAGVARVERTLNSCQIAPGGTPVVPAIKKDLAVTS